MTTDQTLSLLMHARSKVGKSTLASTAPGPVLVIDAEGSWKFIGTKGHGGPRIRKITWNPARDAPPRADGTWDVCRVSVTDWTTLSQVYGWLLNAPHDFRSIVMDSISELQRRLKANLVGTEQMKIQDWGSLLTRMDAMIRGFRDLTLLAAPYGVQVAVFIAESREDKGVWTPYMQGQISVSLPYWMDVVGFLYVDNVLDANGQPTGTERRLLVAPHPQYVTGERVQGVLGDIISQPNITTMLTTIYSDEGIQESLENTHEHSELAGPEEDGGRGDEAGDAG